jgi:nondiscriminating glutamyl-tRNA synthetase
MAVNASNPPASAALFSDADVVEILVERGWFAAGCDSSADLALTAWLKRAADLLGPHAEDRESLADLLGLVFNYEAAALFRETVSHDVLAREGARDVIRELANRVLEGGDIDSNRFKQIINAIKSVLAQRSRELFHPVRLALTGRVGEGELDRVILLLDAAAKLPFVMQVKGTRQRILEFCAALD